MFCNRTPNHTKEDSQSDQKMNKHNTIKRYDLFLSSRHGSFVVTIDCSNSFVVQQVSGHATLPQRYLYKKKTNVITCVTSAPLQVPVYHSSFSSSFVFDFVNENRVLFIAATASVALTTIGNVGFVISTKTNDLSIDACNFFEIFIFLLDMILHFCNHIIDSSNELL